MKKVLITLLGKGRDNPQTGYRNATYRFENGMEHTTPFFGLALAEFIQPKTVIILGTSGSMWGVLVEYFVNQVSDEMLRLELLDAESRRDVSQELLDRVSLLLSNSFAHEVILRLIPKGVDNLEQVGILEVVADTLRNAETELHFDVTHGFRHLAIIGFLSAAMLERLRKQIKIDGLWYGALDMTLDGMTPVLRLDGLHSVQSWISALDRFDANGDYGVFADLLKADGFPADKARCLSDAAFYESCTQISNAARSLRTVLSELDRKLYGTSALFQSRLLKRFAWANENNLAKQQILLARRALERGDILRSAILGIEALLSHQCIQQGKDANNYKMRESIDGGFQIELKEDKHPDWLRNAYWNLKNLRNSLAHGTPPAIFNLQQVMNNAERLHATIREALTRTDTLINNTAN